MRSGLAALKGRRADYSSSVRCHLHIVEENFKGSIGVNARTSLEFRVLIGSLHLPFVRLGIRFGPSLASRDDLVSGRFDAKFDVVPSVGFPGEGSGHGSFGFRLPGLEFEALVVAEENQVIPL